MSADRLAEIKAREQAAFGGPWEALDADENGMHAVAVDGTVLVEVGDFCDAEFIAHARDDIPHLLALVESLTAERDAAIAWRVEANRVHAARVESLREEFGKREDSQDRIRERLTAEVERLERWKFEACEVMSGLRELGKALGLRPGVQITGPAALAEVARLAAERDALIAVGKRQAARLARVEAYVLDEHGQSAGHAIEALAEEWDGDDSCDNRTCVPHRSADALRAALAGSDADTSDTQPTDQEDQS